MAISSYRRRRDLAATSRCSGASTVTLKVIDTSSIMQLANGAYLDTKNNILTLPDGTQIDTVTGLKVSTTA